MTFARTAALIAICLVWLGMLTGVSFVATPVKFAARSLELPVALDVGRATFALFSKIEWALCLAAIIVVATGARHALSAVLVGGLTAILLVQALWLLPALDARVAAVIAGAPSPPSRHHLLYAVFEACKTALLAALAVDGFMRISGSSRP